MTNLLFLFPPLKNLLVWEKKLLENGTILPKITTPDLQDNLCKGLFDALQGIVYDNDSRICRVMNSFKGYSPKCGTYLHINLFENIKEIMQFHNFHIQEKSYVKVEEPDFFKQAILTPWG